MRSSARLVQNKLVIILTATTTATRIRITATATRYAARRQNGIVLVTVVLAAVVQLMLIRDRRGVVREQAFGRREHGRIS